MVTCKGHPSLVNLVKVGQTDVYVHSSRNPFTSSFDDFWVFWIVVSKAHQLLSAGPVVGCMRLSGHTDWSTTVVSPLLSSKLMSCMSTKQELLCLSWAV